MASTPKRYSVSMNSSNHSDDACKRRRLLPFNLLRSMKKKPKRDISERENQDRELEVQNQIFKNQSFSSNGSISSTSNGASSPASKNKFKNMVLKLIPECRLKYNLTNNGTEQTVSEEQPVTENRWLVKRRKLYSFTDNNSGESSDGEEMEQSSRTVSEEQPVTESQWLVRRRQLYSFTDNNSEESSDGEKMKQSSDKMSHASGTNFGVPTKAMLKLYPFDELDECRLKYNLQNNGTEQTVSEEQPVTENRWLVKQRKLYSFTDNNSEESSDGEEMEQSSRTVSEEQPVTESQWLVRRRQLYSFTDNNSEEGSDGEEMKQSSDKMSVANASGTNFGVPTKAMLKLYPFDELRSDEGAISAVDDPEDVSDQDTSFRSSTLDDITWFGDRVKNDRINLQQYISQASVGMETMIERSLNDMGDNTRLKTATQNYVMYQIRQAISTGMLLLEWNIKNMMKEKEDLVLDVADSYKIELSEANDLQKKMQKMCETMLSTVDKEMLKEFKQVSRLGKKMRNRKTISSRNF